MGLTVTILTSLTTWRENGSSEGFIKPGLIVKFKIFYLFLLKFKYATDVYLFESFFYLRPYFLFAFAFAF